MENKFNLTREQNVFVAKRNIVDYIWKSANLEGIDYDFKILSYLHKLTCDKLVLIED